MSLALVDLDVAQLSCDQNYKTSIVMNSQSFKKTCSTCAKWDNEIRITTGLEIVSFIVKNGNGDATVKFKQDNTTIISGEAVVSDKFSTKYLVMCSQAASLTESVQIYVQNECPLKLSYRMYDGGKLDFFVAPKVEE